MNLMHTTRIGKITIDIERASVVSTEGIQINLRPQTFSVFSYLCQNRGRVVTKSELLDSIWAGSVVTNDSIVKCIAEIRKEIGDASGVDLKTISRRGYLLTETELAGSCDTSVHSEIPTIAVLPFRCLSPEAQTFAAGLTEDITTHLSFQKEIFVQASCSANPLTTDDKDPSEELTSSLRVKYLLQASVQKMASELRINVQLSDAQTSTQLWSERYIETGTNFFEIQDDLSAKIVNRIGGTAGVVITVERSNLLRERPGNPEAYDLYIMASNIDKSLSKEGNAKAVEQLKKVVDMDPLFSRAWMRLASLYLLSAALTYTNDLEATVQAYIEAAMRAVELDPNDALCQAHAGGANCFLGRLTLAKECFERAINLGPNNADALALVSYIRPTKFETVKKDLENIRRAKSLNPYFPMWYSLAHGYCAYHAGEYQEAIDALEQADTQILDPQLYLALCYAELGNQEKTDLHRENLFAINPNMQASQVVEGDSMQIIAITEHFYRSAAKAGIPH